MMGCTPAPRAASKNLIAPKRLDGSVIASAGMPSAAAAATASSTRAMPSTIGILAVQAEVDEAGAVMRLIGGEAILPRRSAKKRLSTALHSSASTPPSKRPWWLKVASAGRSTMLPQAPVFGSAAP